MVQDRRPKRIFIMGVKKRFKEELEDSNLDARRNPKKKSREMPQNMT